MNVLDLFSGIGGFSLGLERAGMRTVAFCEIDPYCRRVLAKHWPTVPCYDDIRSLTADHLAANAATGDVQIDVICGGFPCQDISCAGKGKGLDGARSGLWSEYARIIGEVRPQYIIVENVAALLGRGLDRVLGDLASLGYNAEWHCIPASAVGAPHRRDRVWIIAYPESKQGGRDKFFGLSSDVGASGSGNDADAAGYLLQKREHVACLSKETSSRKLSGSEAFGISSSENDADAMRWNGSLGRSNGRMGGLYKSLSPNGYWPLTAEPVLGGGTDGVPNRVDRLKALGNAVVPQIPEVIGRAIMSINP